MNDHIYPPSPPTAITEHYVLCNVKEYSDSASTHTCKAMSNRAANINIIANRDSQRAPTERSDYEYSNYQPLGVYGAENLRRITPTQNREPCEILS